MCLINVREEEDYSEPARYRRNRRATRSPSPSAALRFSRRSIIEERQPDFGPLPPSIPPPRLTPAPSSAPLVFPTAPPSAGVFSAAIKSKRPPSKVASRAASRARSARSRARTAYVEENDEASNSSSSSSDLRSRRTGHSRKSSHSRTTLPASEYSMHEREVVRERSYPSQPGITRHGEPHRDRSRYTGPGSTLYSQTRANRDSHGRSDGLIVVEEDSSSIL